MELKEYDLQVNDLIEFEDGEICIVDQIAPVGFHSHRVRRSDDPGDLKVKRVLRSDWHICEKLPNVWIDNPHIYFCEVAPKSPMKKITVEVPADATQLEWTAPARKGERGAKHMGVILLK